MAELFEQKANKIFEQDGGGSDDDEIDGGSSVDGSESSVFDLNGGGDSDKDDFGDSDEDDSDSDDDASVDEGANEKMVEEFEEQSSSDEEEEEEEEDGDENYLQKMDEHIRSKVIENHHPELKTLNYEEVEALATIVRDKEGQIIDPLHRTNPILSRYEKARALGERARQINSGAKPMVEVEPTMIDGYLIALKELEEKRMPFIIQRPLPSGGSEYWRLADLEILH